MSQVYDVGLDSLMITKRGRVNEPRNIAVYIVRKRYSLRLDEIGSEFGLKKFSSMSSIGCRTEQQLDKNRSMRDLVKTVTKEPLKSQAKS